MEFKVDTLAGVAKAVHQDMKAARASPPTTFGMVIGEQEFRIDHQNHRFLAVKDRTWKRLNLPFWDEAEIQAHLEKELAAASKELGDDKAATLVLFDGAVSLFGSFAAQLANEGDGRLSALTIKDIMEAAARHAVTEFKTSFSHASWASTAIRDAWMRLMDICCQGLYGPRWKRAKRHETTRRFAKAAYGFAVLGLAWLGL